MVSAFEQLFNGVWQVDIGASQPVRVGLDEGTQKFLALALVGWIAWGVVNKW